MSDIRWIQRLNNFKKAFKRLDLGLEQATNKALSELEKEGLIQRFEYTQELSWKTIKDFYEYLGETNIQGSKDAFKLAVNRGLVDANCGAALMHSIDSRNNAAHDYNEEDIEEVFHAIVDEYHQAFDSLKLKLENEPKQPALNLDV
jgi:nucleotidyltransferase substrate binding protein (TIGR01987 family)